MISSIHLILSITLSSCQIPITLNSEISKVSAARVFPSNSELHLGYNHFYRQLNDAIIDDSGYVHMLIEAVYADTLRTYTYLKYNQEGAKCVEKEIFNGTYHTNYNRNLYARILILEDLSVLILYPDDMFYLCWLLLERNGEISQQGRYENLRGLANFRVCGTALDSIHIISWSYHYWTDLLERYDLNIGKYYIGIEPSILPKLFYTNNYILAFDTVSLCNKYRYLNTPYLVMINDTTIFCFFDHPKVGYSCIIDQYGNCAEGDEFFKANLDDICFSKINITNVFTKYSIPQLSTEIDYKWVGLATLPDTTIGVGLWSGGFLYLLKFDMRGKLVNNREGSNRRCDISQMDLDNARAFIAQIFIEGVTGDKLNKTIYYWGFNPQGDFFIQIY